jgi:hypothetical protein
MRRTTSIAIVLIPLLAVIPSRTQTKDIGDIDAVKQVEQTMGFCDGGRRYQYAQ